MIKLLEKIVIILSICGLLSSCVDDTFQKNEETVVEGIPVTASLSYRTTDATKITRATEEEEKAIGDVFVIIFDEAGKYSGSQFVDIAGTESQKKISLETTSGTKRVYAVANLKSSSFTTSGGTQILVDKVQEFLKQSDAQKTLNNWLNMSADMTQEQVTWGTGNFLMSGRFVATTADTGDGKCVFNTNGSLVNAGEIKFDRSVASIAFEISAAEGVTFTPTSWSVRNVPKSVYVYQKDANPERASYFHTTPAQVSNNKFSFYMLENREKIQNEAEFLQKIEGKSEFEIADIRETYDKSQGEEPVAEANKKYTYAPQAGTYVVLKGSFSGKANNPFNNDKSSSATAQVTYFIHLGYAQGTTPATDFEIMRNYKYTYKVKVLGVNKIIVEAMKEGETYRADGDVVFTDAEVLDVDAHYSRVELTFTEGEDLGEFQCEVSTAATDFLSENVTTSKDVNWVQFIQKTDGYAEHPNFTEERGGPSKGLMNINELADKFHTGKVEYDRNGKVSFYAYIKENYYDSTVDLNKFINFNATTGAAKTRVMTIALRKGNNGHSSVSSARYIIRQKPIISIFNMDDSRVQGAKTWGVEWVNENEGNKYPQMSLEEKAANGLEYGAGYADSKDDGLANMKKDLKQNNSSYIKWNNSEIGNKAYAACMSRNRDENGNGKIDDSEIKWYLPAINQYQHLWVGMNAIPDDATLYPNEFRDASAWWLYHYYSNTNKSIFWAEEGSAFSNDSNDQTGNSKKHIRCARNIGSGSPMKIASTTVNGANVREIAIDYRLASSALRKEQYNSGQLLLHNEYSEQNKVFKNFLVSDALYAVNAYGEESYSNQTWQSLADGLGIKINDGNGGQNICKTKLGEGWRAPNQRELILLTSVGGYTDNMFSATYFSMYYNGTIIEKYSPHPNWGGPRIGYRYAGTLQLVTPPYKNGGGDDSSYTLKIRCVKDTE